MVNKRRKKKQLYKQNFIVLALTEDKTTADKYQLSLFRIEINYTIKLRIIYKYRRH